MTDLTTDFVAGYEAGYLDGIERGRRDLEAEWCGRMAVSAAIARQVAARPSYAELAVIRGDQDRAARQRRLLANRGVSVA